MHRILRWPLPIQCLPDKHLRQIFPFSLSIALHNARGGEIEKSEFETDPYFRFQIPISLGEIDSNLLNPVRAWDNLDEYHTTAKELVQKFQANYKQYDLGDTAVLNAGPSL